MNERRATRVFIKRSAASAHAAALLDALRDSGGAVPAGIEAAALVTEMLLVAADGSVVPSTITFEVQLRIFNRWGEGDDRKTQFRQYELSRKLMLSSADSGGLAPLDENAPAYLPAAGNDLAFATRPRLDAEPVLVRLRERCAVCHGRDLTKLITFALIHDSRRPRPPVEHLNPSENTHAHEVAARKTGREEFLARKRRWAMGPA